MESWFVMVCATMRYPAIIQRRKLMNVYDNLKNLGIELPAVSAPAAAYVPSVQTGKLIFVSGNIARKDGAVWVGQLGKNISVDEAGRA
jgi:hypothetical protein